MKEECMKFIFFKVHHFFRFPSANDVVPPLVIAVGSAGATTVGFAETHPPAGFEPRSSSSSVTSPLPTSRLPSSPSKYPRGKNW